MLMFLFIFILFMFFVVVYVRKEILLDVDYFNVNKEIMLIK